MKLTDKSAPPDPNIRNLVSLLRERRGWLTASKICRAWRVPVNEDNKRYVRELAAQAVDSKGKAIVVSTDKGYCLTKNATVEEMWRARGRIASMERHLKHRRLCLDRALHG